MSLRSGDAQALDIASGTMDFVVSGLVLNFVPDRLKALNEMKRVTRPGGTVSFYVWDYPGGGVEFLSAFWTAVTDLDPGARDFTEDRRFSFCTAGQLLDLAMKAGLSKPESAGIEATAIFKDFDDLWHPFTLGAGPAPGYCASLNTEARQRLRERLRQSLPQAEDGSISLNTRAWAIRAGVT